MKEFQKYYQSIADNDAVGQARADKIRKMI